MIGLLFDVETHTITYHLKKVFLDYKLVKDSVIRNSRTTVKEGKSYNTNHYNFSIIIPVGYKVNFELAVFSFLNMSKQMLHWKFIKS